MSAVRLARGLGKDRVTRRGFVFGALALAASAAVGRTASAAGLDEHPLVYANQPPTDAPLTEVKVELKINGHLECTFADLVSNPKNPLNGTRPVTFTLRDATAVTTALKDWFEDARKAKETPRPTFSATPDIWPPNRLPRPGQTSNPIAYLEALKKWDQIQADALRDLVLIVQAPSNTGETLITTYKVTGAALKDPIPQKPLFGAFTVELLVFAGKQVELVSKRKVSSRGL